MQGRKRECELEERSLVVWNDRVRERSIYVPVRKCNVPKRCRNHPRLASRGHASTWARMALIAVLQDAEQKLHELFVQMLESGSWLYYFDRSTKPAGGIFTKTTTHNCLTCSLGSWSGIAIM